MKGFRLASAFIVIAVSGAPAVHAQVSDVDRGRQLFAGKVRFAQNGPPCAACHDAAGLPRPGGGTVGPDLTDLGTSIGAEGVKTALETLYFPTMAPLFAGHALTAAEQQAIGAFLANPAPAPPKPALATLALGVAAIGGTVILLALTWIAGRSRVHSVRVALLARAAARKVAP